MVEKNPYHHKHYTHVKDEKEADAVAWAFLNKDEMVKFPFKFEEIGEDEVRCNIIYTGLCQSDSHTCRSKWGPANYPIAPGHEVVGIVSKVGKNVKKIKVGDRVGFGPTRDNCQECRQCIKGENNICQGMDTGRRVLYGEYWGGYATAIQQPARWAFKIPENLPSDKMSPLFCAGVTVHAPLARYAKPGDRLAVIGIGGLGHLAVMYGNKFGCEVTAFTHSKDKIELLKKLGAHKHASSTEEKDLDELAGYFDVVINTLSVSNSKTWGKYVALTTAGGTYIQVGAPPIDEKFEFQAFDIVAKNIKIAGSVVGSIRETQEMLDFSARHNILPMVELFRFDDFPKAFDKLENGKPQFRCVVNVEEWSKKNGFFKEY